MNTDEIPQDSSSLADAIDELKQLKGMKFKDMGVVIFVAILYGYSSWTYSAGDDFFPAVVVIFLALGAMDIKDRRRTDAIVKALTQINRMTDAEQDGGGSRGDHQD